MLTSMLNSLGWDVRKYKYIYIYIHDFGGDTLRVRREYLLDNGFVVFDHFA